MKRTQERTYIPVARQRNNEGYARRVYARRVTHGVSTHGGLRTACYAQRVGHSVVTTAVRTRGYLPSGPSVFTPSVDRSVRDEFHSNRAGGEGPIRIWKEPAKCPAPTTESQSKAPAGSCDPALRRRDKDLHGGHRDSHHEERSAISATHQCPGASCRCLNTLRGSLTCALLRPPWRSHVYAIRSRRPCSSTATARSLVLTACATSAVHVGSRAPPGIG